MIYFMKRTNGDIKIGYTASNVVRRKATLELEQGELELLGEMDGDIQKEKSLHALFAKSRIDNREWFRPTNDLLAFIQSETRQHKTVQLERIELPLMPLLDFEKMKVVTRFNEYVAVHGITLADVCDGTGLSMFTVSRLARGHITRFDDDTMRPLCRFFKCRLGEMIVAAPAD